MNPNQETAQIWGEEEEWRLKISAGDFEMLIIESCVSMGMN